MIRLQLRRPYLTQTCTLGVWLMARKPTGRRAGRRPYGYRFTAGRWEIDEGEAETVRRIYSDFLRLYAHATLSELAADLNVDGVITARGASWHASTVRAILVNPVYCGEEGLPAIVEPATFAAAQRRLDALKPGPRA